MSKLTPEYPNIREDHASQLIGDIAELRDIDLPVFEKVFDDFYQEDIESCLSNLAKLTKLVTTYRDITYGPGDCS